jgi:hypothetical protein
MIGQCYGDHVRLSSHGDCRDWVREEGPIVTVRFALRTPAGPKFLTFQTTTILLPNYLY